MVCSSVWVVGFWVSHRQPGVGQRGKGSPRTTSHRTVVRPPGEGVPETIARIPFSFLSFVARPFARGVLFRPAGAGGGPHHQHQPAEPQPEDGPEWPADDQPGLVATDLADQPGLDLFFRELSGGPAVPIWVPGLLTTDRSNGGNGRIVVEQVGPFFERRVIRRRLTSNTELGVPAESDTEEGEEEETINTTAAPEEEIPTRSSSTAASPPSSPRSEVSSQSLLRQQD